MNDLIIKVNAIGSECMPSRATDGSAGYDLRSRQTLTLNPGDIALVMTGVRAEIPQGIEVQIRPRSSLALMHGITVANSPGTIDSDFRGEWGVILANHGHAPYTVTRNQRIAQAVFSRYEVPMLIDSGELGATERGDSGFGSTGTH